MVHQYVLNEARTIIKMPAWFLMSFKSDIQKCCNVWSAPPFWSILHLLRPQRERGKSETRPDRTNLDQTSFVMLSINYLYIWNWVSSDCDQSKKIELIPHSSCLMWQNVTGQTTDLAWHACNAEATWRWLGIDTSLLAHGIALLRPAFMIYFGLFRLH